MNYEEYKAVYMKLLRIHLTLNDAQESSKLRNILDALERYWPLLYSKVCKDSDGKLF